MSEATPNFGGTPALPPAPVVTEKDIFKSVLPPRELNDVWLYFRMKQNRTGSEIYEGYHMRVFPRLSQGLDLVAQNIKDKAPEDMTVPLRLQPPGSYDSVGPYDRDYTERIAKVNNGERLTSWGDMPDTTRAFMELTYRLTGADVLVDDREKGNEDVIMGPGRVVLRGTHRTDTGDYQVYFIETYGFDELGEHITWDVTNSPPEDLLDKILDAESPMYDRPFITTGEEIEMKLDVYNGLRQIRTIPIDEAEIVESWIRSQAA
jgi:hypothetical protein